MQTHWTRTPLERWCCGELHPAGTPFLVLEVAGVTRKLWRCPSCADAPAPADLPPMAAHPVTVPVRAARQPAFDWKARQSGEREPGQEG